MRTRLIPKARNRALKGRVELGGIVLAPMQHARVVRRSQLRTLWLGQIGSTAGILIPVSYTHLDVYKRQPEGRGRGNQAGADVRK